MKYPTISVVIPTHNRPASLGRMLHDLARQELAASEYEVVVVDDGSQPPVILPDDCGKTRLRLIRTEGVERSRARNAGASAAEGMLLVFLDDDLQVDAGMLTAYVKAHAEWPDAMFVGAIRLSPEILDTPYWRFRQRLEDTGGPTVRGMVAMPNYCAAGNMAIAREIFLSLGGFDPQMASSEDQDLALRHTHLGRPIVYVPEARVVHHDNARDFQSYCRRSEWGSRHMHPFCRRHPDLTANRERERINGPVCWGKEPAPASIKKQLKLLLATPAALGVFSSLLSVLERTCPRSRMLSKLYSSVLGLYIFRGYRAGMRDYPTGHTGPEVSPVTPSGTADGELHGA